MTRRYAKLEQKLNSRERLKVLFLNDIGFQHGAGIAQFRQVQSFLLLGHEVMALCGSKGQIEQDLALATPTATGIWSGIRDFPQLRDKSDHDKQFIIDQILEEVRAFQPDVIIVGNLHGVQWPLELLPALQSFGALVVGYMHDCYLISGRCAQPGTCRLFETGCNETCPTAHEYPILAPSKISDAWRLRREIFCGPQGVPLATNSCWTLDMARRGLRNSFYSDVVYLGLDERLFRPIDRVLSRQLLGIPQDVFVILSGAVHVNQWYKGPHLFQQIVSNLSAETYFLVFGTDSGDFPGVHPVGMIQDVRKLPLLYSAADLFISTAIAESFGQTLCEAAACGLPIVTFGVGGGPEVARHGLNARVVDEFNVPKFLEAIKYFMKNPNQRAESGWAGRALVETEFSLRRQAERWSQYLRDLVQYATNAEI
jgi:glycosyltransferase involved in cell wall biosynthesis